MSLSCGPDLTWNPIDSAEAYSAVSGIMASAVLAAIGVTLARERAQQGARVVDALAMSSLILLVCAAFEFAVIAGEKICARAAPANLRAGSFLAVGSIAVIGSLMLLAMAQDPGRRSGRTVMFIALVVAAGRMGTGAAYSVEMLGESSALYSMATAASAVVAPFIGYQVGRRASRKDESRLVRGIYLSTLALVGANVVLSFLEELPSRDEWVGSTRWLFLSTAWLFGLLALGFIGWLTANVGRAVDPVRQKVGT